MLLGKYNYESICSILQVLQSEKGNDAVKSWCIDFGMDLKHCRTCDEKTPVLNGINTGYECAICKTKME